MKIFVTGGTGFVGREVVRQLADADHEVIALVRPGSEDKLPVSERIKLHQGDVKDPDSLQEGVLNCDAVIHLVGIIRESPGQNVTFERLHVEATQNVVNATASSGIRRYLHMSANGVGPENQTDYHRTKWQAEKIVRNSDLDWTIFRPSLIFGSGGEFVEMLAGLIRKLPVVPVIGDGQYRMQPVAVSQVGETYLKALTLETSIRESYELGGAESYTFNRILDLTGRALGRKKVRKIHQPVALVQPIVNLLESFSWFPMTNDQLVMMLEGNVCNPDPWAKAFNIEPQAFSDGIADCFRRKS